MEKLAIIDSFRKR